MTLDLQRVKVAEDESEEVKRPKPTAQTMCDKSMWVHYPPNILRSNKVQHDPVSEEIAEEEERNAAMKKLLATDPYEPRLKSIT